MKPILNIENLTKIYGNVPSQTKALNGITFQVMPGEFLGIMGSSGSGKSTLLNCIATVIQPTGGSIQVEGVNLQALKGRTLADYRGKKVGYLFQNFELLDNLTGRENILLPTSLHGIPEKESNQRLSQLAKYLEINDVLDKFPSKMSGGQRQRVAAARARLPMIADDFKLLPCSEEIINEANLLMLEMIKAYDKSKNDELLVTAKKINDWLQEHPKLIGREVCIINKYQIKIRKTYLGYSDKAELFSIIEKSENNNYRAGAFILLGEFDEAKKIFDSYGEEQMQEFINYPIYTLYQQSGENLM